MVIIGITFVVDKVFRGLLDIIYNNRICGLTYTLDLLRPKYTYTPLVQTYIARYMLKGISNARSARGRRIPISLISISIISFAYICLLIFFIKMTSSDIFIGTII